MMAFSGFSRPARHSTTKAAQEPCSVDCVVYSDDQVLEKGLSLLGVGSERLGRKAKLRRFLSDFGKEPSVYASVWKHLQTTSLPAAQVKHPTEEDFARFLWTMYWFNHYPNENHMANRTGWCDKTVREFLWTYIEKLSLLSTEKIVWKDEWTHPGPKTPKFILSVDGIHCPIEEPTAGHKYAKNTKYYSHKFETAGLSYEVALSVWTSEVAWVNGPYPAGKGDREIFREALASKIPSGRKVIADSAYLSQDLPMLRGVYNADTHKVRLFKRRVRMRHESFFGKMHVFDVLTKKFRHGEAKHALVFRACVLICAHQIDLVPLFDP